MLPPPSTLTDSYGEFDLPTGRIMIPRNQFAQYGIQVPEDMPPPAPAPLELQQPGPAHPAATDMSPVSHAPMAAPGDPGLDSTHLPVTPPPGAAPVSMHGQGDVAPSWMTESQAPPPGMAPQAVMPVESAPNVTTADYGDVYAQQNAAGQAAADAQGKISRVEGEGLSQKAAILDDRNVAVDAEQKRWADREAANQAAIEQKTAQYEAKVKEFADKKVDRRGFSVMEIIGVALSGLGSAMKGQGDRNPALDMALAKIDKAYEDGLRERDQLGKRVGMAHDAIEMAQTTATNTQAQKKLAMAAIAEKTANYIESTAAKFESKIKQIEPLKTAAQLRQQSAEWFGEAVKSDHKDDQDKAQLAAQERASKRSAYVEMRGQDLVDKRERDSWLQTAQEAEKARQERYNKAKTDEEKESISREVPDLFTAKMGPDGKPVIGPDGKPVQERYLAGNKEGRDKVASIKAARDLLDVKLSEAIRIRNNPKFKSFGAFRNTPEYQSMNNLVVDIGVQYSKLNQLGAYDAGIERAVNNFMGGDPKKGFDAKASLEKIWANQNATAGFEAARRAVNDKLNYEANAQRYSRSGDYIPINLNEANLKAPLKTANDEKVEKLINEKTPSEIRDAAKPGLIAKTSQAVFGALDPVFGVEDRQTGFQDAADSEASAKGDRTGRVSKAHETAVTGWAKDLKGADSGKAAEARKSLITLAMNDKRPDLASYSLEALAKAGDEQALGEIEAKLGNDALSAGATAESQVKAAQAPVRLARESVAREAAANQATSNVQALAKLAADGDHRAAEALMNLKFSPQASDTERFAADRAIADLARKRKK